jgi:glycosyltransferase involved in cell wall biosynthesis
LKNPEKSTFSIPKGVEFMTLHGIEQGGIKKYWVWLKQFVQILKTEQPDIVLSFGEVPIVVSSIARILGYLGKNIQLIHNVRNHESTFLENAKNGKIKKQILKWSLNKCDIVTGNSKEIAHELKTVLRCSSPVKVIYNPIDLERFRELPEPVIEHRANPLIINIARLDRQKGQEHLLKAFARVQAQLPEARLTLVGDGPEKSRLLEISDELGLHHIQFVGWSNEIPGTLAEADLFCLSSLWEGMPNVLLEALAVGLPIVAFDCQSGPREILADGKYGKLVATGDVKALSCAILELLQDIDARKAYAMIGKERVKVFDSGEIVQQWFRMIEA